MFKYQTILIGLILLSGCTTNQHQAFDHSRVKAEHSAKLISDVENPEVYVQFVPSNAGSGVGMQLGPVGAMVGVAVDAAINSSRAKDAEAKAESFRLASSEVDIRNALLNRLQTQSTQLPWRANTKVVTEEIDRKTLTPQLLAKTQEDFLIVMETTYHFKPKLQTVEFVTQYRVWSKNESVARKKGRMPKPLYSNTITYQAYPHNADVRGLTEAEIKEERDAFLQKYPIDDSVAKKVQKTNLKNLAKLNKRLAAKHLSLPSYTETGDVWLKDDGKLLKEALVDGANEIAQLLVADLSGAFPAPAIEKGKKQRRTAMVVQSKEDGRITERQVDGTLVSRHRDFPLYSIH